MEHLQSDLSEFVGLFNALSVEFVVVGGYAVAFHGHPRLTGNIDLFVRPTHENATRILGALDQFGFEDHGVRPEELTAPDKIIQLGSPPNRIDLLTSITGLDFDEAWAGRVPGRLGGHEVNYLGLSALLKYKSASARTTDLADVEKLLSITREDTDLT